jgi:hypothetical protein
MATCNCSPLVMQRTMRSRISWLKASALRRESIMKQCSCTPGVPKSLAPLPTAITSLS